MLNLQCLIEHTDSNAIPEHTGGERKKPPPQMTPHFFSALGLAPAWILLKHQVSE